MNQPANQLPNTQNVNLGNFINDFRFFSGFLGNNVGVGTIGTSMASGSANVEEVIVLDGVIQPNETITFFEYTSSNTDRAIQNPLSTTDCVENIFDLGSLNQIRAKVPANRGIVDKTLTVGQNCRKLVKVTRS